MFVNKRITTYKQIILKTKKLCVKMGVPSTKQKQHRQREIVRRVKFRRVKLYGLTAQSAESAHRQFLSKLLSMLSEWANLWG